MPNIVETAVSAGNFTTLVAAVQAAGLVDTLSGPGPFTVFAPTDAAFANLPSGSVESLLADMSTLTSILTHHVVPGSVHAADLLRSPSRTTVQGTDLTFKISDGIKVNDATVTRSDIRTSNGVIHVINKVLIPAR
jgi:uncharacterized surface protein with fasciclin (FAS1) repeats